MYLAPSSDPEEQQADPTAADALAALAGCGRIAHLRAVMDVLPVGVYLFGGTSPANLVVLGENAAATEIAGAPLPCSAAPFSMPYTLHGPDRQEPLPPSALPAVRAIATGRTVANEEIHLRRPDGAWRVVLANAAPVRDAGGAIAGAVLTFQEITARERGEQALREREQALREVLRSSRCILWGGEIEGQPGWEQNPWADSSFVWHVTVKPDNLAAQSILPLDLLPGQSYSDAFYASHPAEDQVAMSRTFRTAFQRGDDHYAQEYRCLDRDGLMHWMHEDVSLQPIAHGRWKAVFLCTDITEHKQAEEERGRLAAQVGEQRDLLQSLVTGAPAGIALLEGPEHRFILANPAYQAMARGKGEIVGRTVAEVWPELAPVVGPLLDHVHQTGEAFRATDAPMEVIRDRGPEQVHFTFNYEPLRDEAGQVRQILVLVLETTEQVQARRQVDELAKSVRTAYETLQAQQVELQAAHEALQVQAEELQVANEELQAQGEELAGANEELRVQAEQLREHAERKQYLASFPERNPNPVIETDLTGSVTYANPAAAAAFPDLVAAGPRHAFLAGIEKLARRCQKGGVPSISRDVRCADVVYQQGIYYLADRQTLRVYCLDVTERVRAEEALRKSQERFRVAQEMSLDAFALLAAVRDGHGSIVDFRWEYVNPEAGRILKHAPDELVGQHLLEVLPGDKENSDLFDRYIRVVEAGEPHDYELYYESEGIRGWFRNMAVKLGDGIAVSFSDITARKQIEETLRAVEHRQRAIIDNANGIVWLKDLDGRFLVVNEYTSRLLGRAQEEVIGRTVFELFPRDVAAEYAANDAQVLAAGEMMEFEEGVPTADGPRAYIAVKFPLRDAMGRVYALGAICTDITERKRMEEALRHADRRKDEFLAMLAHELRNPLAAITSAVTVVRARRGADPALQRAGDVAARQARHMARLVDDLLDVSRVTQGKITLKKEEVSLASVIESAVESASPQIQAGRHELFLSLPGEILRLVADPVRLAQVFSNLLNNAAKYTPPGGEIHLSLHREGEQAIVRVRDNGAGIAPELLPHVFDLFVQAERAPDRAQGGLGIGLTMVRSLVEMHGGRVEAHCQGSGKGSEFVVRLPLTERPAGKPEAPGEDTLVPASLHILVVDDNADAAEMLSALLEMDGHEVAAAHSGPAAIELAARHVPDVVLLDIGMPGMDGFEVARRLRQEPALSGTRLVALTGYGQEEDRDLAREAGFDHHLVKPVDMAALHQVLAGVPGTGERPR